MEVNIDEDTLAKIAELTQGKYYRADSTDTLQKIYQEIDRLEKSEVTINQYLYYEEVFHWFAFPALGILLLETILNHTLWRRLP